MAIFDKIAGLTDRFVEALDPQRAVQRAKSRVMLGVATENGYQIPGSPRKAFKGVTATLGSPARDIDGKLEGARAASRDASQNTGLATAIFRRFRTAVIGSGLQVQPRPDWKFLGVSQEQANEFSATAIREFDMWAEAIESDYCGQATFQELQALLFMSSLVDGDCFFALPWVPSQRTGWPYETTVRVIDADLVRTPDEDWGGWAQVSSNAKIRNGVEYDANGRLTAYWVANHYRDDLYSLGELSPNFQRIPVYDVNGERQIYHVLEHERNGQRRGLPLLAPVIQQLKMVTRLCDAELMSNVLAAMFTVFIRDNSGMGGLLQEGYTPSEVLYGGGGEGPNATQNAKSAGNEWDYELGSGNIYYLDDNKTIDIAETREKKDFDPYFRAMASIVSAGVEAPYEVILQTFQASYSAMRGAILEFQKRVNSLRTIRGHGRIVRPVYNAVIHEGILKGRISAPRYFDDIAFRQAWLRAEAVGPGSGQIDPVKEARASVIKISNGLSTREYEYAQDRGGRWVSMIEKSAAEKEQMEELGLNTVSTLDSTGPELEGGL